MKIISWEQLKTILSGISAALSRIGNTVKVPTGKYQMLVTDENGEGKWVKRTHWEETSKTALIENETFTTDADWGEAFLNSEFIPVEGETYTVIYDGETYQCVAFMDDGVSMLGNLSIIMGDGAPDTGEPFIFDGAWICTNSFGEEHTISIYGNVITVHKLDSKFLPEMNLLNGEAEASVKGLDTNNNGGKFSFEFGERSSASGNHAVALGNNTRATGYQSFATGYSTSASGTASSAGGYCTEASGAYAHSEGNNSRAKGTASHAEGDRVVAAGDGSHAEGASSLNTCTITGSAGATVYTVNSGINKISVGDYLQYLSYTAKVTAKSSSTVTLEKTLTSAAINKKSAYIIKQTADGECAHVEGQDCKATGNYSHAEGNFAAASGDSAHAEGEYTTASGPASHAEGRNTSATANYSHAEGQATTAGGWHAHAEGYHTRANGRNSHAEGEYVFATGESQHAQGRYNVDDASGTYAHIVGNGTAADARSNAHTLDWDGNAWFQGTIKLGGTGDTDATKEVVATPSVTADDNGKFLRVVDGAWAAVALPNAEEATF